MSLLAADGLAVREASGLLVQYFGHDGDPSRGAVHKKQRTVDRKQDSAYDEWSPSSLHGLIVFRGLLRRTHRKSL